MTLILLPNLLDESLDHRDFLSISVDRAVASLDGLIAETEKKGRHYLMRFDYPEGKTFRDIPIHLLNEHTQNFDELIDLIQPGQRWGVVSDCGLPCLADPGSELVKRVHRKKIALEAYPGPSSIIYALMLSGLPSQSFTFHGYLPRKPEKLKAQLRKMEKEENTSVFIEAPYRNNPLLSMLLEVLNDRTMLSVAWNISLPTQQVMTLPIREWKKRQKPALHKQPAVFLFRSA